VIDVEVGGLTTASPAEDYSAPDVRICQEYSGTLNLRLCPVLFGLVHAMVIT